MPTPPTTDPLREAFRSALAAVLAETGIAWAVDEVENVYAAEDGKTNFIALEFGGGSEDQYTWGSPGSNFYTERGQVMVRLVAPLNAGREPIEGYARAIASAFRNRRFATAGGIGIRSNSGPPSGGASGVRWILTVAIAYRIDNIA